MDLLFDQWLRDEPFAYNELMQRRQELLALQGEDNVFLPAAPKSSTVGADTVDTDDTDDVRPPSRPSFPRVSHVLAMDNNKQAMVCSRTVPITPNWNVTVWEWQTVAPVIETYWQVEQQGLQVSHTPPSPPRTPKKHQQHPQPQQKQSVLDPFGLVTWPGSVVAALELLRHRKLLQDKVVWVIGAGVGVEAQAAAVLGAKTVIATDVHPTTMQLLEYGVQQVNLESQVVSRHWDLFGLEPPPHADIIVCADVLYNDKLANQLIQRIGQVYQPKDHNNVAMAPLDNSEAVPINGSSTTSASSPVSPLTLIVDSQRFCHSFEVDLNAELKKVGLRRRVSWQSRYLPTFTGSGVVIDEDQTYDVKARVLWIGL